MGLLFFITTISCAMLCLVATVSFSNDDNYDDLKYNTLHGVFRSVKNNKMLHMERS